MKKILIIFIIGLFILTGCDNAMNTPTSKVEEFLGKYQKLDKTIVKELDEVLENEESMSDDQKKEYKILLEKQYQNLSYKIKNEDVEGTTATVDVEVEVLDYQNSINKSKEYFVEHKDEFTNKDESSKENNNTEEDNDKVGEKVDKIKDEVLDKIDDISSFIDYKIKELKSVDAKTKYDITFNLTKVDGKWKIDELSEDDRKKLHGLY